jgi:peptidoglycan/xylan/chitin deacetylase (PgdA/CDA1 family)
LDLAGPDGRQRSARALTRWLRGIEAGERERKLAGLSEWLDRSQVLDTRVMMDANELTGMVAGGSTVGAHTLTHPLLTEVGEEEARRELIEGKARLESLLGRPVRHLSYPNPGAGPQHDASVRAIAREAGYVTATTSTGGLMSAGSDPLAISRFGVTPGHQERLLFRLLGEG